MDKIFNAILLGLSDVLSDVYNEAIKMKDSIFPYLMDSSFIADWEKRFKLKDAVLTEDEARDRLAARWTPKAGLTAQFIEGVLQESGFNVIVLKNEYVATGATLGDFVLGDAVLEGNTYAGQKRNYDPCVFAGPGTYLIMNSLSDEGDLTAQCPLDPDLHKQIFFIQAEGVLGTAADIPADRWTEFREIVLRNKPEMTWAVVFANLI